MDLQTAALKEIVYYNSLVSKVTGVLETVAAMSDNEDLKVVINKLLKEISDFNEESAKRAETIR